VSHSAPLSSRANESSSLKEPATHTKNTQNKKLQKWLDANKPGQTIVVDDLSKNIQNLPPAFKAQFARLETLRGSLDEDTAREVLIEMQEAYLIAQSPIWQEYAMDGTKIRLTPLVRFLPAGVALVLDEVIGVGGRWEGKGLGTFDEKQQVEWLVEVVNNTSKPLIRSESYPDSSAIMELISPDRYTSIISSDARSVPDCSERYSRGADL
jgi:hypothetical protein